MFLRAVFSMFVLQTIFFHVYFLKDDIQLNLGKSPNSHVDARMFPETALSPASPYTCTSACPLC